MVSRTLSKRKSQAPAPARPQREAATTAKLSTSASPEQAASLPIEKTYSDSEKAPKIIAGSLNKGNSEVICRKLEQMDGVAKAFYGYTVAAPDKIQFKCIIKKTSVNHEIQNKYGHKYSIKCQTINRHNEEDDYLIDREREQKRNIGKKKKKEIEGLISKHKEDYFKKHSNLIDMFACKLKSAGYDTNRKPTKTTCIVFLVKCKGIIPLDEDLLPPQLGKFPTDVRQAYFFRKVGGEPKGFHQNLKIGCEIGTEELRNTGTIGMFVNYMNEGVKGITCAHVLLDDSELEKVQLNFRDFPVGRICYQPAYERDNSERCGKLRRVQFTDRLDLALFDIDESRRPDGGHFPNYENIDIPQLNYRSVGVLDQEDIPVEMSVYKYGKVTGVTMGYIYGKGKSAEFKKDTMNGLLEIHPVDSKPFSKGGDSGSLLFHKCANNEIIGIGILVGGGNRRDFAIPLSTVLESFDNCTPAKFQTETRGRKRKREFEVEEGLPRRRKTDETHQ